MINKCAMCDKEINTPYPQTRYCPECRAERKRQDCKERYHKHLAENLKELGVAKTCAWCGNTFYTTKLNKVYCTEECAEIAHNKSKSLHKGPVRLEKVCGICGTTFITNRPYQKFCRCCADLGKQLRQKAYRQSKKAQTKPEDELFEKVCPICGKDFTTSNEKRIYCSEKCRNASVLQKQKAYQAAASAELENQKNKNAHLDQVISEAYACGLTYGQYKVQVQIFGKTFEELKAEYDSRMLMNKS